MQESNHNNKGKWMRLVIGILLLFSTASSFAKDYTELNLTDSMTIIRDHYERLRVEMLDLKKQDQNIRSIDEMLAISNVLIKRSWPVADKYPSPKREKLNAMYNQNMTDMITHLAAMKIALEKKDLLAVKTNFEGLEPCVYRERHFKTPSEMSNKN